jgi:probable phosphoglycerate mutase
MTDFLLIRHGETDWNRELRFQGQVDVPLNDIGLLQAQRLEQRFEAMREASQTKQRPFTRVISSDLQRAQQTAAPLARVLGHECMIVPGLREQCFGDFEGLRVPEIKDKFPSAWQRWLDFDADYAVQGAESTRAFHDRVIAALGQLAAQFQGEHVVVVTHGGVLDMIWRNAQALSLHGPRVCDIPNAGVNHVAWRDAALHIQAWADTAHLADMPPQPIYRQTQHKA